MTLQYLRIYQGGRFAYFSHRRRLIALDSYVGSVIAGKFVIYNVVHLFRI